MKEEIEKWLADLKGLKISVSTVEKDLKFSNGLLGKAAKGGTKLSEEKYEALREYHGIKTGNIGVMQGDVRDPNSEAGKFMAKSMENIKEKYGPESEVMNFDFNRVRIVPNWAKKIEDYCGAAGITPEELIEQHAKKITKPTKSEASKSSDDKKEAAKFVARGMSNYDLERRKIKNGF